METTAHYTRVGIFVILFTIVLVVGLLWLSFGISNKTYNYYFVYLHESVSGLSLRSAVKYNGVDVGYVQDIALYKKNPQQVQVLLEIDNTVPVYNGTRAVLEKQGITGISYIELRGGEISDGLLKATPNEHYPVIKTAPSLMKRLSTTVDQLSRNIENITDSMEKILTEQNAHNISTTLENFVEVSTDLRAQSANLKQIMDDAKTTLHNTAHASKELPAIITSVKQAATSLESTGRQADALLRNGAATMQTVNNQLMPQTVSTMNYVQTLLNNLTNVSQQMEENPAVLVRGRQPAQPGPGE